MEKRPALVVVMALVSLVFGISYMLAGTNYILGGGQGGLATPILAIVMFYLSYRSFWLAVNIIRRDRRAWSRMILLSLLTIGFSIYRLYSSESQAVQAEAVVVIIAAIVIIAYMFKKDVRMHFRYGQQLPR
jgi:uncharacterized membrane protein